jgi:hypothetical protein
MKKRAYESVMQSSQLYSSLVYLSRGSVIVLLIRTLITTRLTSSRERISTLSSTSILANTVRISITGFAAAVTNSTLTDIIRAIEQTIKISWLYQWLTAEPESEVVTVNLRETFAAGPVINISTWTISLIVPAVAQAQMAKAARWVITTVWTAPIRAAGFALIGIIITEISFQLVVNDLSTLGFAIRAAIALLAVIGMQFRLDWDSLLDFWSS